MKEDEKALEQDVADVQEATAEGAKPAAEDAKPAGGEADAKADSVSATLEHLRKQATESDDAPVGSLTLKQIVGGDYLLLLVRHHIWLIVLIVIITTVYVGFRYQCQQDMIEIDLLEKNLTDAKYKAMSSSSNLTELCRQSHVLQVLRANQDSLLRVSDQPPYKIQVP